MELTMSMFANKADYWKARAELAERTVIETANELGCEPDNEAMLEQANRLRSVLQEALDGMGGSYAIWSSKARAALTPNEQGQQEAACGRSAAPGCSAAGIRRENNEHEM